MQKLLPIGTICTLKNRTIEVMIVGTYVASFSNGVVIYDYQACNYPEGMTLSHQMYLFNHNEIDKVLYKGYENEKFSIFEKQMKSYLSTDEVVSVTPTDSSYFSNIQFDENGYVISATPIKPENPFTVKESVTPVEETKNSVFKHLVFDEEGYVVSDGEQGASEVLSQPLSNQDVSPNYLFDEEGYIVEDHTVTHSNATKTEKNSKSTTVSNGYVFDEEGYLIEEPKSHENKKEVNQGNESIKPTLDESFQGKEDIPEYEYVFDDNGMIISTKEKDVSKNLELTNIFEEPKIESLEGKKSGYTFDENGIVIAEE